MNSKDIDKWMPFYTVKWLFGSTRHELEPDERGVWTDLMAMASFDDGFIRANKGVPYPERQLAGLFCVSEELLHRTLLKCLDPKIGKLKQCPDGSLYMCSWESYRLTRRHQRRFSKDEQEYTEGHKEESHPLLIPLKEESKKEEKRIEERESSKADLMSQKEDIGIKNDTGGPLTPKIIQQLYNDLCHDLTHSRGLSPERMQKIKSRLKEHPDIEWWTELFTLANEIHLPSNEQYPNGWKPDLWWLIKNGDNSIKVLEGKYDNHGRGSTDPLQRRVEEAVADLKKRQSKARTPQEGSPTDS